ncbi:MAG: electron transfer flavoprotein [Desulfuromonas sp.]|nr:MAG: electron transfer flavoprotein [Desulfuromonas sp.]
MPIEQIIYIALLAISVLAFAVSCAERLELITLGAAENRFDAPLKRLQRMLSYAFAQKRVLKRPFGFNHSLLFWGFLLLSLANAEFLIDGLFPGQIAHTLPEGLYRGLAIAFDIVSLVTLVCVGIAVVRRLFFPPDYLGNEYTSARSRESLLILAMIASLMLAFFLLHAAHAALGIHDTTRPVSALLGSGLTGLSVQSLETVALYAWWGHAAILLIFLNLLPRSKHMHILTAIPNTFFANLEKTTLPSPEVFEKGARFGVGSVEQFSWKDLLDSFTCTECGRCQDLCPAYNTGKGLNPRRIVHDIKVNLLKNGPTLKEGQSGSHPLTDTVQGEGTSCVDALWDCTTCGACINVCPVLIEQMPKIIKMRRHLVQEKAEFPSELLTLFENMEQRSNPWGIAPSERSKWSNQLGDRLFDAEQCDILFFVGCAGSFDTRAKQVSVALTTILDQADVRWGILGKDELCCGDSVRRLGNEYVFDQLARQNVELFKSRGVTKIVTACPHCFSTLKNDYRQYGLEIEVLHHSELIAHLVSEGRLKLPQKDQGALLFHDSCYLGRHNDTYEAPRQILQQATGKTPQEFERRGENAFCCGAGGGRMWLEEVSGERINRNRVKEALHQSPDTICVSCPYCMTMMEDGLKDEGDEKVRVKDVAEVVAEALRP